MPDESSNTIVGDIYQNHVGAAYPNGSEQESEPITGIDAAWLIWSNRRFIFRACLYGLILFTVIAFLLPKKYTATTQLMPPDFNNSSLLTMAAPLMGGQSSGSESGSGGGGGALMGLASQFLGLSTSSDLFVGVLQSDTIEDKLIQQFNLQDLYSARYIEDARKALEAHTDIDIDKKTGIISISVEDKNPQRAAAMAQAYAQELDRTLAAVNTSSAHRERVFIETRLEQVKSELDKSIKEFSIFSSKNSTISLPDQARAMVDAAAQMQGQLIAAQSELKGLQQIYTDQNVRVREAKARVGELQAQVNKFGGKDVDPYNVNESTLAKSDLYPSVRQLPLVGIQYADLYRKTKIDEAVYELLTKQYEVAKIQEARDAPGVQILDPAMVPTKKSSPHRLWIMLGGLFLALVFATAWTLGQAIWARTDPNDPRRLLAESILKSTLELRVVRACRRYKSGLGAYFHRRSQPRSV